MAKKSRLLAIRSEKGRGVYELPSMKQRNELIIKYAGKLEGVSCRTFKKKEAAFGEFKGKVKKITKNSILFEKLYIEFDELCGDCVAFTGLAYAYKRKDDSIDFSLKECEDIEIIKEYELPTDEALDKQSAERLACEACVYSEHCDGLVCIAADGYLETMTASILDVQKNLKLQ